MRITLFITAAALFAAPVFSQAQSPADEPPPPAGPGSDAAAANTSARAIADTQTVLSVRPEDQAAYDADMAAYRAAVQAHQRAVTGTAALADHQERAYADAMHAWRVQVADCHRGVSAACKAPTPNPADFW